MTEGKNCASEKKKRMGKERKRKRGRARSKEEGTVQFRSQEQAILWQRISRLDNGEGPTVLERFLSHSLTLYSELSVFSTLRTRIRDGKRRVTESLNRERE